MTMRGSSRVHIMSGLLAAVLCVAATVRPAGQGAASVKAAAPVKAPAGQTAGFKEFSDRVQAYIKLRKTVEPTLPALKATDVPELIAAHQAAMARKIREARPRATVGDVFTPAACDAFRRASQAALQGPHAAADALAYMQPDGPNQRMHLEVNGVYPDTEPITAPSPALLAAFPPLPVEVAYRVVGRTLLLVDVNSRLIVDLARLILPPAS